MDLGDHEGNKSAELYPSMDIAFIATQMLQTLVITIWENHCESRNGWHHIWHFQWGFHY